MISINLRSTATRPHPSHPRAPVASLGTVEVVALTMEKAHSLAQLAELAYARADRFLLLLVESGSIEVRQRSRRCRVEKDHYAVFDCSHALTMENGGEYSVLAIFIPAFLLQARLRHIPTIVSQPYASAGSPWRIASSLLRMLLAEVRHIPTPVAYGYATQVVELVSIAVEADNQVSTDSSARHAIFRRCAAYVKANVADADLDPNKIAAAMGISVRYLHKVFQECGKTVCEFLRTTRLEVAHMELADPQRGNVQIREIAHRVGFRSQAHFAAAFRQHYGVSATEWRRSAVQALHS